jgi:ketosteroid isomerase-like protein/predicted ester cyclase
MSVESTKAIVRNFVEGAWNYEKLVALENLLTPDYTMHCPAGEVAGRRAFRDVMAEELESMASMYVKVDDILAEDDRAVVRTTTLFELHGEFMGAFGVGQTIRHEGISIHRVADGRVAESWEPYDRRCLLRDLGGEQSLHDVDRQAIRGVIDAALRIGLRDKRAHTLLYYAEGAEVVGSHGEAMRGRNAILQWFERFPPIEQWKLSDIEIDGAGEVAYVRGSYTMRLAGKAKLPFDSGRYLEVWRKQADGTWKVIRHAFSSEVASRTRRLAMA